jgi:LPXTG-motif cell wall-anchored protein
LGVSTATPPPAVGAVTTKAPTATLPFTGSDVAELTVIGGLAIAGGAVLVRSGRRRPEAQA